MTNDETKFVRSIISRVLLVAIIIMSLLGGCAYCNTQLGLKNDNVFEEAIEEAIKRETGIDLDLTPFDRDTYSKM